MSKNTHCPDNSGKNNPMYGKRGELSPHYGKHRSVETKQKIGDKARNRKWVNNHKKSKLIKGEELDKYLNARWILGRLKPDWSVWNKGLTAKTDIRLKISGEKISKANCWKNHSPETRQKMSKAHKGKKFTEEHREKLSKSCIGEKMAFMVKDI